MVLTMRMSVPREPAWQWDGPRRTLRVLRWPELTKSRRLLRPVLLAYLRGTSTARETTGQTDSVIPNVCEASIKLAPQSDSKKLMADR